MRYSPPRRTTTVRIDPSVRSVVSQKEQYRQEGRVRSGDISEYDVNMAHWSVLFWPWPFTNCNLFNIGMLAAFKDSCYPKWQGEKRGVWTVQRGSHRCQYPRAVSTIKAALPVWAWWDLTGPWLWSWPWSLILEICNFGPLWDSLRGLSRDIQWLPTTELIIEEMGSNSVLHCNEIALGLQ